jgi:hypothetical protein
MALAFRTAGSGDVPETHLVGLAGGIEGIVYRRLRAGEVGRLAEDMRVLGDWAVGFAEALGRGGLLGARLVRAPGDHAEPRATGADHRLGDWRADLSDPRYEDSSTSEGAALPRAWSR